MTPMASPVEALRAAFEGEGREPSAHLRHSQRLKSEWPALYGAIAEVVYEAEVEDRLSALAGVLEEAIGEWEAVMDDPDDMDHEIAPFYVDAFETILDVLRDEEWRST